MLLSKTKLFIFTTIISLTCLLSIYFISSKAFENNQTTFSSAVDIYKEVLYCYKFEENPHYMGPIKFTKGTLSCNNKSTEIYWIFLCGLDDVENQPTNVENYLKSFFSLSNDYQSSVLEHISNNIPTDSKIIISGHSLGGMVAQQLANNTYIKENYTVLHTITYGSPLLNPNQREGNLKRYTDVNDPVPYFSIENIIYTKQRKNTQIKEVSKYIAPKKAHIDSYAEEDTWGIYDVLGNKNGNATFTFDNNNTAYYQCTP